ncbi:hypothetical protein P7C73_g1910, partial [Tremellales sp. Uapishka_1]
MELDECADQMTGAAITGDCAKGTTHGLGADPKVEEVFGLLEREGSKDYDDYEKDTVTQLEHALQAAHLASQSGAEESTIVAALLHDIGQLLPHSESKKHINGQSIGRTSHATIGENYLLDLGFPKVVAELVGSHVLAKRYLVATDQGYLAGLAFTSVNSLKYQVCHNVESANAVRAAR